MPAGRSISPPISFLASNTTISRLRYMERCWNPSSSTMTSAPHSRIATLAASARRSPTTTDASGNFLAICTGSSPPCTASTRTLPPHATITTPCDLRPNPLLTTPTRLPRHRRYPTIYSTSGVFPVPPAVIFPTEITGTSALLCWRMPASNAQFLTATTEP